MAGELCMDRAEILHCDVPAWMRNVEGIELKLQHDPM
jgi:hypothetical protein